MIITVFVIVVVIVLIDSTVGQSVSVQWCLLHAFYARTHFYLLLVVVVATWHYLLPGLRADADSFFGGAAEGEYWSFLPFSKARTSLCARPKGSSLRTA